MTTAVRFAGLPILALLIMAGCGESKDDIYQSGYEEGYDAGQYDVCRELNDIAPTIKDRLQNCRGV